MSERCAGDEPSVQTALVLAGGAGTRLRSVVADRPKPLAWVDGAPFLLRVLDQLAAAGIRRAVLCTGHLGDIVERQLGRDHRGMALVHAREERSLGTAGALRAALPHVPADEQHVLVLNGDSYCDFDLQQLADWAIAARARAALLATLVADSGRYGQLQLGHGARVAAFAEKGAASGAGQINAGVYCFDRTLLEDLDARAPLSLEHEVLPALVASGDLLALPTQAPFLDIGTPDGYAEAPAFFARCARRRQPERLGLLVLDRDGTLIAERHYLSDPAGVELLPGVVEGLRAFTARGFALAIVTNQSGINRGLFDEAALAAVNAEVLARLAAEGIHVHGVYHCPHRPDEGCRCRKPGPALLERALRELGYGAPQCLVIGDKQSDVDLARRGGARAALVRTGYGAEAERTLTGGSPVLVVDSLAELAALVLRAERDAVVVPAPDGDAALRAQRARREHAPPAVRGSGRGGRS